MSWNTCTPSRTRELVVRGVSFPAGIDRELRELAALILETGCARTGYKLRSPGCWGYYCRVIAGTRTGALGLVQRAWRRLRGVLSYHGRAGGRAVDVNAPSNARGTRGDIPMELVRLAESYGFTWGGRWSFTDPMHLEFRGSKRKARRETRRARRNLDPVKPAYRVGDRTFARLNRAVSYLRAKLRASSPGDRGFHVEVTRRKGK